MRDPEHLAEIETQATATKRGKGTPKDTAKEAKAARRAAKTAEKTREKSHTRDSLQALPKLGELVDGRYRIVSQPPIVVPARDLAATYGMSPDEVGPALRDQLQAYQATLQQQQRRTVLLAGHTAAAALQPPRRARARLLERRAERPQRSVGSAAWKSIGDSRSGTFTWPG